MVIYKWFRFTDELSTEEAFVAEDVKQTPVFVAGDFKYQGSKNPDGTTSVVRWPLDGTPQDFGPEPVTYLNEAPAEVVRAVNQL